MGEDGKTVGIWIGPDDEDLLAEFDELVEEVSDSRSGKMKDAMRLYLAVEDALADAELEMTEQSKRRWLQSMIRREGGRPD